MPYNIKLAKKVIESCENSPEGFKYDMSTWGEYHPDCGAAMCLAGWTVYHGHEAIRAEIEKNIGYGYENDRLVVDSCEEVLSNSYVSVDKIATDLLLGEDADLKSKSICYIFNHDPGIDPPRNTGDRLFFNDAVHLQLFKEFFGLAQPISTS